jgi:hypothetical protein
MEGQVPWLHNTYLSRHRLMGLKLRTFDAEFEL